MKTLLLCLFAFFCWFWWILSDSREQLYRETEEDEGRRYWTGRLAIWIGIWRNTQVTQSARKM